MNVCLQTDGRYEHMYAVIGEKNICLPRCVIFTVLIFTQVQTKLYRNAKTILQVFRWERSWEETQ